MIGQSQVTAPLMTALRTNRVNHAYLFSGPRGCGKTTSARILARCLNCAEGPTDTPCGVCPSCIELSRDGGGSLDVVEIDAASHGGVDDARDLRERAIFAPARDRYKIFIIDEAHMVTSGGFNALLKIVEEPPEHVKFIFATTEPDKVIGTIRSRTHHYPFRLIPPAQLLEYTQQLCESEGVKTEPGVLPLAVRAGGGSARDTLSLLDQLIAGSEGDTVEYERAVGLLGYTHTELLDEVIEALGGHDGSAAFAAVDRVVQTGQDPRRFVEDLLERIRDLIVVSASGPEGAAAVLRGVPEDELQRMFDQASVFGPVELSRTADVVNKTLNDMTGATSPRLHLEFMVARALVPNLNDAERGALTRLERIERRIGVSGPVAGSLSATNSVPPIVEKPAVVRPVDAAPVADAPVSGPPVSAPQIVAPQVVAPPVSAPPGIEQQPVATPVGPVTLEQMKHSWQQILDVLMKADRRAWMAAYTSTVRDLNDDILVLSFPSAKDVASFKGSTSGPESVSEQLRTAIHTVLGLRVRFVAKVEGTEQAAPTQASTPAPQPQQAEERPEEPDPVAAQPQQAHPITEWNVVAIPGTPSIPTSIGRDVPEPEPEPAAVAVSASVPVPASVSAPVSVSVSAPSPAPLPTPGSVPVAQPTQETEFVSEDEVPPPTDEWAPPPPEDPGFRSVSSQPRAEKPFDENAAKIAEKSAVSSAEKPAQAPTQTPVQAPTAAVGAGAAAVLRARTLPEFETETAPESSRYGESVVREILGATFLEEELLPDETE